MDFYIGAFAEIIDEEFIEDLGGGVGLFCSLDCFDNYLFENNYQEIDINPYQQSEFKDSNELDRLNHCSECGQNISMT